MVARLRQEGVLPSDAEKLFEVTPRPARARPIVRRMMPAKPPPVDDRLNMRPCTILELDATRCHWPLGDVEKVASEYCGGVAVSGRRYCAHHWVRAWEPWVSLSDGRLLWVLIGKWVSGGVPHTPLEKHQ